MEARHRNLVEAKQYEERKLPSTRDIYMSSDQTYAVQKMLIKKREMAIPGVEYKRTGVLPVMSALWMTEGKNLVMWRYESGETEEIGSFSSEVLEVKVFIPRSGVFNEKVSHCLFVATEDQVMIYGIEKDTMCLVNTDFVASTPSKTTCIAITDGDVFIGCENGGVYQVIYKSMDTWSFKIMHVYDPGASILSSFIPNVLRRKRPAVRSMSVGRRFLVSLGRDVTVYNVDGGMYKVGEITMSKEYVGVQIVDESDERVFFYAVQKDGSRDFYDGKVVMTKRSPNIGDMTEIKGMKVCMSEERVCMIRKGRYDGSIVTLISRNEDQVCNFDRLKSSESYEVLVLKDDVDTGEIYGNVIFLIGGRKMLIYEVQQLGKFLLSCRSEDIFSVYKSYGEREILVLYYELLGNNEDVGRLEYLCLKNEDAQLSALFVYLYRLMRPVLDKSFEEVVKGDLGVYLEKVQIKMKSIRGKLKAKHLRSVCDFIDEFLQTCFYMNVLYEYSVCLDGKSLRHVIFEDSAEFKKRSLKAILDLFKVNQSVEPLIKTLSTKCPLFLPIEEVYYQRGLEMLSKRPSRELLFESLSNLKNVQYNENLVEKYNEFKFYHGSTALIKENFSFDFEYGVDVLKKSVRCTGALNLALEDPREDFLYALFEALLEVLKANEFGRECSCCSKPGNMVLNDVIRISVPFLERFLKEKSMVSSDPQIYELHWKYCVYRNEKMKGVSSLLDLADNKPIPFELKVDLLRAALSVSVNTPVFNDVKMRLELADIQAEIIRRGRIDPAISNRLLSADELFNDYAYKHPDLALRIVGISNYTDKTVIKELWEEGMGDDFLCAERFLGSVKASGAAMDCRLVGDLLCSRMVSGSKVGKTLVSAGFGYSEVLSFLEEKIKGEGNNHPEVKRMLLEDLKEFSNGGEVYLRVEEYCRRNYGI
ncbi:subunit of nuclear pore complex [Ordospora colligata]|uniref:Subunit Nup170 of nuclear pore complex n=1 Tax=Ordospora colligata OC4 TaxID=1354746 RepID=A0A0B2UEN8_9MICR|nr:subunit Nup170 of nuclear pore complex [Ordospora colligata OC4]KHN69551.1 subunit Nup170 of nuclear pore complex [Ordospora colligata OC4]TBU15371.1 subunit of nuclear pore complex [Ordospora colligata]TBU15471.1 subunit of nuclear pore complex [Ordospora colligata]TBU18567.1 subunit of nuclear pore complex [Ordospora colligata]